MKEGKVFKRILAIALVVVMTITMVPFGVFATGEAPECAHNTGRHEVIARVEPTCTTDGHYRYYQCVCGKYFNVNTDGQLSAPIDDPSTYGVIPNLGGHDWTDATCTTPKTCSVCGATEGDALGHTGGTATCTTQAVCSVCGQSYGAKANHSYSATYTVDRDPTCTDAGEKSKHCQTQNCDAKTDVTPIPATGHNFDKTKADGKCTECKAVCPHDNGEAIPAVEATCTEKGSTAGFKCSDCGFVRIAPKETNALGHDIEVIPGTAPTCTATGKSDGQKCKRCDYEVAQTDIPATGHDFTATTKTVIRESTCSSKGSKAIVCKNAGCDAIKEGSTEEIEMKPHDYKAKAVTIEATCETAGEKAKVCKNCTAKTEIEATPALGHDWDDGTVKVPADCTKDGVTTYKCKRTGCGKTEDRKVDKLEHEYKEEKVEATCEKDGYSVFTCQCGDEYIAKKVEKFGHSFITYVQDANTATCYSDGTKTAECDHGCGKKNTIPDEGSKIDHKMTDFTTIKPATCTEEGEEEGKCFYFDKCGYSESYPTDALGHTVTKDTQFTVDKPATCTEKGSQSKHCERCDYTEGTEEIPALGHDYQPGADTDATCTTGGHIKYVCTRCSDSYDVDDAEPLGHDFKYVSNNNATCKEDGTETGKCSRCDVIDTRTEVGSKLPHTLAEAVVIPATTEENGSSTTTCTVCDEVVEAVEIAKIAKLSLKYKVATYDGKTKHPKLTITDANGNVLVKGTDYTVEIPTKEESAKAGKHTYTVTFMGNYEGEEEVSYKVLPGKTSKISSEKKQTEIKLSWKAVKGATGYRVYVYNTKTKKYNIVTKYVKGKTSYTVKDLKANTSYKFAVKAYTKVDGELFWAEESTKVTVKTLVGKTSKITAAPAATSVKLSWKKVSGADGYRVYVYNAKTKSYKILEKNVTGTSYTVKGLKAGTSYKFAVKAYDTVSKKTVWSNQYTTVNVTTKR